MINSILIGIIVAFLLILAVDAMFNRNWQFLLAALLAAMPFTWIAIQYYRDSRPKPRGFEVVTDDDIIRPSKRL